MTDRSDEDELDWTSQWLPVSGGHNTGLPRLQLGDPVIDPPGPFEGEIEESTKKITVPVVEGRYKLNTNSTGLHICCTEHSHDSDDWLDQYPVWLDPVVILEYVEEHEKTWHQSRVVSPDGGE